MINNTLFGLSTDNESMVIKGGCTLTMEMIEDAWEQAIENDKRADRHNAWWEAYWKFMYKDLF